MNKKTSTKSTNEVLEVLFQHEMEKSVRLRGIILIGLLSFVGVSLLLVYLFFGEQYKTIFESNSAIYALLIYAVVIVVYEIILHFLLASKGPLLSLKSNFFTYATTFSEIGLFSALLVFVVERSQTLVILSAPAVLTYFILIILSTLYLNFKLSIFSGLLAAITYVSISFYYSYGVEPNQEFGISVIQYLGQGIMMITAGISAGFVARLIKVKMNISLNTILEKNEVVDLFGQQISQQIAQEILENPHELSGVRKNVTIMFLDIRNFTPFVENKEPEEVVDYLNKMFGFMIDIVQSEKGIINQFLGDGFMATFGAPISVDNSSERAVKAAERIIETLNQKIKSNSIPETRVGIGIHFGEAVTGNIGSMARKQYSITGNVVILASRIEQLNKRFNGQVLISEEVFDRLGATRQNKYSALGPLKVKGRERPISIYLLKEGNG